MEADTEDGWRHLLQVERGRLKALQEKVHRLASTALDAMEAKPQFLACTKERLESIIHAVVLSEGE